MHSPRHIYISTLFSDKNKATTDEVWTKFADLAETHFVQRIPEVEKEESKKKTVPVFTQEESDLYSVPPFESEGR